MAQAIREGLADSGASNAEWQRDLYFAHARRVFIAADAEQREQVVQHRKRAFDVLRGTSARGMHLRLADRSVLKILEEELPLTERELRRCRAVARSQSTHCRGSQVASAVRTRSCARECICLQRTLIGFALEVFRTAHRRRGLELLLGRFGREWGYGRKQAGGDVVQGQLSQ